MFFQVEYDIRIHDEFRRNSNSKNSWPKFIHFSSNVWGKKSRFMIAFFGSYIPLTTFYLD